MRRPVPERPKVLMIKQRAYFSTQRVDIRRAQCKRFLWEVRASVIRTGTEFNAVEGVQSMRRWQLGACRRFVELSAQGFRLLDDGPGSFAAILESSIMPEIDLLESASGGMTGFPVMFGFGELMECIRPMHARLCQSKSSLRIDECREFARVALSCLRVAYDMLARIEGAANAADKMLDLEFFICFAFP